MERLYAVAVVLSFISFTVLVGIIVRDMRKMRKVNEILTEILRSGWIRTLELGNAEIRKAG
jgi:hypothetical protein